MTRGNGRQNGMLLGFKAVDQNLIFYLLRLKINGLRFPRSEG